MTRRLRIRKQLEEDRNSLAGAIKEAYRKGLKQGKAQSGNRLRVVVAEMIEKHRKEREEATRRYVTLKSNSDKALTDLRKKLNQEIAKNARVYRPEASVRGALTKRRRKTKDQ